MLRRMITACLLGIAVAWLPLFADILGEPDSHYTSSTTLIDISGFSDGANLSLISGGGLTVFFSGSMMKLSVPATWGTWNSPPFTESSTPPILFTNGASSVGMMFSSPVHVFGFEAQPDLSDVETLTATYFEMGSPVATVTRDVSGNAGALLFALSSPLPITSVQVTDATGNDFAIAEVRYSPAFFRLAPEPSLFPLLAAGLGTLGVWKLRSRRG